MSCNKKERIADQCYNMDEIQKHYAQWIFSHKRRDTIWFHLFEWKHNYGAVYIIQQIY